LLTSNSFIFDIYSVAITSDAYIAWGFENTLNSNYNIKQSYAKTIASKANILQFYPKTILQDAYIGYRLKKTLISNSFIFKEYLGTLLNSNSRIVETGAWSEEWSFFYTGAQQKVLYSDAHIMKITPNTIVSDMTLVRGFTTKPFICTAKDLQTPKIWIADANMYIDDDDYSDEF
jgi:hypothetical protein